MIKNHDLPNKVSNENNYITEFDRLKLVENAAIELFGHISKIMDGFEMECRTELSRERYEELLKIIGVITD